MPDETEIWSITDDKSCLCGQTQEEILTWIVQHLSELGIGKGAKIVHDPFGWVVTIEDFEV